MVQDFNLYDDVQQDKIELMKKKGLLREINIKAGRSRKLTTIIFSKNHEADEVDKLELEEKAPPKLMDYWNEIDKERNMEDQLYKASAFKYLAKHQSTS